MKITKDTTLKELYELQRHCMDMKEKTMGTKSWMCYECEYYAPRTACKWIDITGKVPFEWELPRVDYE